MLSVYGENSQNTMEWKKAQDTHKNLNKKITELKKMLVKKRTEVKTGVPHNRWNVYVLLGPFMFSE